MLEQNPDVEIVEPTSDEEEFCGHFSDFITSILDDQRNESKIRETEDFLLDQIEEVQARLSRIDHIIARFVISGKSARKGDAGKQEMAEKVSRQAKTSSRNLGEQNTPLLGRGFDKLSARINELIDPPLLKPPKVSLYDELLLLRCVNQALSGEKPDPFEREGLLQIHQQIVTFSREIKNHLQQGDLFEEDPMYRIERLQHILKEARTELRHLVKIATTVLEQFSWFSPTTCASNKEFIGVQQNRDGFEQDYGRNNVPGLIEYAEDVGRFVLPSTEGTIWFTSRVYSSVMRAASAILDCVDYVRANSQDQNSSHPQGILCWSKIYYELNFMLREHALKEGYPINSIQNRNPKALAEEILEKGPHLLVVSQVSNSPRMELIDLKGLIDELASDEFKAKWEARFQGSSSPRLTILVDTTLETTKNSLSDSNLKSLSPWLTIITVESLVKFRQDGLDLGDAALLNLITSHNGQKLFRERLQCEAVHFGSMPTEQITTALRLTFDPESERKRRQIQSSNTHVVAFHLNRKLNALEGDRLFKVEYPTLPTHPDKCFAVDQGISPPFFFLRWNLRALSNYRREREQDIKVSQTLTGVLSKAFIFLSIEIAKEKREGKGIQLSYATSFGFDECRLQVNSEMTYEAKENKKTKWVGARAVRVAMGMESPLARDELTSVFLEAHQRMLEEFKKGSLISFALKMTNGLEDE